MSVPPSSLGTPIPEGLRLPIQGQVRGLPHPVTVREATWADYHDILAIDASVGAYDAGDYLFGKLAMYLKDPNRLCHVGVYQGKVVSSRSPHSPAHGLMFHTLLYMYALETSTALRLEVTEHQFY